jgi:multidrug resistance protein MdtO
MSERTANYPGDAERREDGILDILWDELKPFPDRGRIALRLAIACTAIILVSNTFRLPLQDVLPFFVLFASKEEKISTAITVLLVLFAITISVGAAVLIFKYTGDRAEFRIPAMALEIFVGMYLFRVLSIGPVGFILAFIVSVLQSLVDLFPTPEEAVHQFLWVWVAVSLSASLAWVANLLLFPIPANHVLQREIVAGWRAVAAATTELTIGSPSAARSLLRPLAKRGPIRLLKLLKLSLVEAPGLGRKQAQLMRMILSLDKIAKLTFSYAGALLKSPGLIAISSAEKAILDRLTENAEQFEQEFAAGFVPSGVTTDSAVREGHALPSETTSAVRDGRALPVKLAEAQSTLEDLVAKDTEDQEPKAASRQKKSLFVADAFTNPRHVQFALKVTLAGMLGYFFYTASDYFGIHTVYYTPLIIALVSTGATIHKGVLRIVGCIIGVILGLICSIWLIPRYETLGVYLLIVFCLHGLAAWICAGSERISYVGLQIAMAFDLGVLKDYGPPKNIDPLRDRFIGIILGVCIISIVFALVWPESAQSMAREKLAAGLRAIARLLHLGGSNDGSQSLGPQGEQLELEIATRLSEANSFQEQAAFEALLYGSKASDGPNLKKATAAIEEIYVACLPWLREQRSGLTSQDGEEPKTAPVPTKPLVGTMEAMADLMDQSHVQNAEQNQSPIDHLISDQEKDLGSSVNHHSDSLEQLIGTVREFQVLASAREGVQPT